MKYFYFRDINYQIKKKKKEPIIKVPKIKLKKFRKFKSDTLWEKENANYESLDSEDSIDISKKINKSNFRRSKDMDRIDLTESNIKKKQKIKKELSKTYLTTQSFSSSNMEYESNKRFSRDVKINIFNESDIKGLNPLHPGQNGKLNKNLKEIQVQKMLIQIYLNLNQCMKLQ
jgi:hypothetical protein